MARFLATIGTFFVVLGLYFVYGWGVVPVVLPSPIPDDPEIVGQPPDNTTRDEIASMLSLFEEDSWERNPEVRIDMIRLPELTILFSQDEIVGNVAKLKPCTLLFMPEDSSLSEEERLRRAVILKSDKNGYAEIEFDGELNLSRFPLPKMKGGRLVGRVTIESDMNEPGPQDDLFLETENIAFTDSPSITTISTIKDVRFRWGLNSGEGTMLSLELVASDPTNPKSDKQLNRVQFETLKRLNLVFPEDEKNSSGGTKIVAKNPSADSSFNLPPLPETNSNSREFRKVGGVFSVPEPTGRATRVDVMCRREFTFLFDKSQNAWIANFQGNVEAVRRSPDGMNDFLNAEEMRISFQPKSQPNIGRKTKLETNEKSFGSMGGGFGNLEPVRFVALGKLARGSQAVVPAKLTSMQSGGVVLVGDQILYDIKNNFLTLETQTQPGASKEVEIQLQGRYFIKGEIGFMYTMGKDGEFGVLTSSGAGNLRGFLGDETKPQHLFLKWNKLEISPNPRMPNQIVLKLDHGIYAEMEHFGTMTAEKFELWCNRVDKTANENRSKNRTEAASSEKNLSPFGSGGVLEPERAVVLNNVRFANENGTCEVARLVIFFQTENNPGNTSASRSRPYIMTTMNERPSTGLNGNSSPNPIQLVQYREPNNMPASITPAFGNQTPAPIRVNPMAPLAPLAPIGPPQSMTTAPVNILPNISHTSPTGIPTVSTQNLLGLHSTSKRTRYKIVGDQMEMHVRYLNTQSTVEHILLTGNVRISEELTQLTQTGELLQIFGDEVKVWNPSTPQTTISIAGKPPNNHAVFQGKGVELEAKELFIDRASNTIWSPGPGRVVADTTNNAKMIGLNTGATKNPNVKKSYSNPAEDPRLLVEWNESMTFDGKTIIFRGSPTPTEGRVLVLYQYQKVLCDVMMIHLNRTVSFFDDDSDIKAEAKVIKCAKNVYVENVQFDGNREKSFDRAELDGLSFFLETSNFVAEGPGVLRSTFWKQADKSSDPAAKNNLLGNLGKLGETPNSDDEEIVSIYIQFHSTIEGKFLGDQKHADIKGNVRAIYSSIPTWDYELGLSQLNQALRRGGFLLTCEELNLAEMRDPGNPAQSTAELGATGGAKIEGKDFFGEAHTIQYIQSKSLVIFDGKDRNAKISITNQGEFPAQTFRYNLKTGAVESIRSRGFNFSN